MKEQKWKLLDRKLQLKTKLFKVYFDNIRLPNGKEIKGYTVIGKPNFVKVIAIDKKNRILIHRETILTFFLVFMVFTTAVDNRAPKIAGFGIGLVVFLDALVGGSLTGAAMNPARWAGPALASMYLTNWYVYIIGPVLGGILAALFYTWFIAEK